MKIKSWILLLAALAGLARVALALGGGQFFLGDESRYLRGVQLYLAVRDGRSDEVQWFLSQPDHQVFTWLAALLAPVQHALAGLAGRGDWSVPANITASAPGGAALLALGSAALVPVLFFLARAAGASDAAAGWAALLAAGSNTLFYMVRHLLPYDAAMLAWLLALWASCGSRPRQAVLAGVLAAASFYIYNGYWYLVPVAALWHASRRRDRRSQVLWLAGAAGTVLVTAAVGYLAGGIYYWRFLVFFSGTVRQGLFAEGWSLPWEYLWHSEGWAGPALLVLVGGACLGRRRQVPGYVGAALAGLVLCYGALVAGSTMFHRFVVYGRSVRPLLPLFCLAAGWAMTEVLARRPVLHRLAIVVVASLAVFAQAGHFGRIFPADVQTQVRARWGRPKICATYSGLMFQPGREPVTRPDLALVNADGLYPLRDFIGAPAGRILGRWPNPLDYRPYQYEGYTPRERALLRAHDNSIRLIALADPAAVPDAPPRSQHMAADETPDGYDHGRR